MIARSFRRLLSRFALALVDLGQPGLALRLSGLRPIAGGTPTPQEAAADWASRLGGATQKIQRGVAGVTMAPGQAAARQKAVYLQNVQASVDKWANNVQKVSLGEWQTAMTEKGINRIATGATAAQSKMADFFTRFLPHVESVRRSLPPRGNLEQNIARMVANARGMSQFGQGGR